MRVLIIKTSSLGDVVRALPVLDYLHQAVPGIEIDWVVEEPFRQILAGNPHLKTIHLLRSGVWRKRPFASATWREIAALRQALRAREFDFVFDIQGDLNSGLICWFTGCADRIGFVREDALHALNLLFTTRRIPMRREDCHSADKYLRLMSIPFAKDFRAMKLHTSIETSPEDDANAAVLLATLSDGLVFLFQYGTSRQTRNWSEQSWVALGKAVLDQFRDASILFPWNQESERLAVTSIAAGIGRGSRVLEHFELKGLTALLKKVDLVVGGDAGAVQLAAAVGTPTVSFYRSSQAKSSAPRGEMHVAIQSPMYCSGCFRSRCDKDAQCRDTIKVEAVFSGITRLLSHPGMR